MAKVTTTGIKLEDEIRDRLKMLGDRLQRSPHWLMKKAIVEFLDREEAQDKRNREADEAWDEYQQTGQYVNHDAMDEWLGTWGTEQEGPCPKPKD